MRVNNQSGFTLTEMIMVIVITGILGSMVAVFIRAPVEQYLDIGRRADMTDIADLALSRMANDLRTAVPSSVLATGTTIEFLPTKDGGRYRVSGSGVVCASSAASAALSFTVADDCFEILGPAISFVADDQIVVGGTQPGADPYDNTVAGIRRAYTGAVGAQSKVEMEGVLLPASTVNQRFEVVSGDQQAVTYACENLGMADGEGTGTLRRYWKYGFTHTYAVGSSAVLANKLYTCSMVIDQSRGLIANTLQFARASEVISLYQEIHVHSSPTIHAHNTP